MDTKKIEKNIESLIGTVSFIKDSMATKVRKFEENEVDKQKLPFSGSFCFTYVEPHPSFG